MQKAIDLQTAYRAITGELAVVETKLKEQAQLLYTDRNLEGSTGTGAAAEIIEYFFNAAGKKLRPALVLLAGNCVSRHLEAEGIAPEPEPRDRDLIDFCSAVELIHCASLVHDDIIDSDMQRRGQSALNSRFGNQIAVLAGDMLYVRAFLSIADNLDKHVWRLLSEATEKMCRGEISELVDTISCLPEYMAMIQDKTGSLMSVCCQGGAALAGGGEMEVAALAEFGLNFGICYQLVDDLRDEDVNLNFSLDLAQKAEEYAERARDNLKKFHPSAYRQGLLDLIEYILTRKNKPVTS